MLRRVEVLGEGLTSPLPLGHNANDDPVQILEITGLDPIKATVNSTPFATRRGSFFQNSTVDVRNIVMTLGLSPNWKDQTISSLRGLLYGYFMTEQTVKLRFFTDEYPVVDIQGVVEACEVNLFSKDPVMQVSIICHQPDFIDADYTVIKGRVTNALVDGVPTEYMFDYKGTVPTGFVVRVKHTNVKPTYTGRVVILNKTIKGNESFDLSSASIDTTKYLSLSTVEAARRVRTIAYSDGAIENLLRKKSRLSPWPQLQPGQNWFSVSAMESNLRFDLVFFNRFGAL